MRINKLLSNYGICSRREANRLIEQGRLTVNGKGCELGQWLEDTDDVLLDGRPIVPKEKIYLILNKPVGITCTAEQKDKNNIIDFLNIPDYVFPVGRLDKDSEGLMFLTNDGELAHQVLAAEHGHEKIYHVTVERPIDDRFLSSMASGVSIDGKMTKPCKLMSIGTNAFQITLSQGLNRQIRKMCHAFYYRVEQLKRVQILNLELGDLKPGEWRHLTPLEIQKLKEHVSNNNSHDREESRVIL